MCRLAFAAIFSAVENAEDEKDRGRKDLEKIFFSLNIYTQDTNKGDIFSTITLYDIQNTPIVRQVIATPLA